MQDFVLFGITMMAMVGWLLGKFIRSHPESANAAGRLIVNRLKKRP